MGSLKAGLELKQQQKLSPLQIQTIKLIELPVQELEQRVQREFEDNPVIDDDPKEDPEQEETDEVQEEKEISLDDLKEDDYIPGYRTRVNNWGKDERPVRDTFSTRESFMQSLESQLGFRNLDSKQESIAKFIIGSLDSDGYLRRDIAQVADDFAFRAGINASEEEVEQMLAVVQECEPAGVGARDLRECLLLQLRTLPHGQDTDDAREILEKEFGEFSNKHFKKIMSRLGLSEERLKAAIARIVKLNPSPGGQVDDSYNDRAQQIMPDFILTEDENGNLGFEMPRVNIPEIRVNRNYARMLEEAKGSTQRAQKEAATFVKQKIDSAKWFVEALKQRQNTLQRTMQTILDYQYSYFQTGDETMLRPMVLKDIAEKTGFDISTISRVVNSKYIQTDFGIYPLKYFFSEGLENQAGEEVSTRELKKALQDCVASENKKKPLTDEQLVSEMGKKGYKVARRTIAKYRNQLGIPLARLRKEL
ncbi:MAG: RNA polymerase factor sigma-54 [Bacteroidales bacterium]|nr:RNA polymerase factor sigma-54 [Bacteroidales bacterium]